MFGAPTPHNWFVLVDALPLPGMPLPSTLAKNEETSDMPSMDSWRIIMTAAIIGIVISIVGILITLVIGPCDARIATAWIFMIITPLVTPLIAHLVLRAFGEVAQRVASPKHHGMQPAQQMDSLLPIIDE